MPAEESTSQTAVKTYVPPSQKAAWKAHAAELDMSQSEFVRTMVQAGRRQYTVEEPQVSDKAGSSDDVASTRDLTNRIRSLLEQEGPLDWDELLAALTDDVESRLDDSLDELQEKNVVRYSGRDGGYTLVDP